MSLEQILLIFVLIALNGFFVGVEFAVVASRRTRLDTLVDANSRQANLVRRWLEDESARDRLIAASQLGITLVSLALGAAGENAFEQWLEPYFHEIQLPVELYFVNYIIAALPLILSLTIITGLHVVLGEQVPKVAVLRAPERFALFAARPMQVFSSIFKGFVMVLDWATHGILSLFGISSGGNSHSSVSSLEELKQIVTGPDVQEMIAQPEQEMLSAVIDFSRLVAGQVMLPRTEIIAVEAETPLLEAIQTASDQGVTKLPVYQDNLDQIVGILHLRDIIPLLLEGHPTEKTAGELAREALFVPSTLSVDDLMLRFRTNRQHIAIVMDEYGGTAGMVTLEDLMEEIIGEMQDSFDATPPSIQPMPDGKLLVDGLTPIEEINEHLGLALDDPNYHTIAGYLLGLMGRIPQVGDIYEDSQHHLSFQIENMDHLRIDRILISHS